MPIVDIKNTDFYKELKENKYDAFAHGCNCQHNFGAGIAKAVKEKFPDAYKADLSTVKGDVLKLGDYSQATCCYDDNRLINIFNLYTQYRYGPARENHFEYSALANCCGLLDSNLVPNSSILMPKIGCGFGGGNWNLAEKIIDHNINCHNVVICWQ